MSDPAGASGADFWGGADDAEALRRFRSLVNAVDAVIFELDTGGHVVGVNDEMEARTGRTRAELLGVPISAVLETRDGSPVEREIRGQVTGDIERTDPIDVWLRTADGERTPHGLRVSPLVEDGERRGAVGIAREVPVSDPADGTDADRRRQEDDLTDRAFERGPVGIAILDRDGSVAKINDRARDLLGVAERQRETFTLVDRPAYDEHGSPVPPEERPFTQALETGTAVYGRVLQVERPDGDRRWLSVDAVPIPAAGDRNDHVVVTYEDVTDVKARERELESELDQVFGRVSDAFYAIDDEYRYVYLNERAEELLGRSTEELYGSVMWEAYPGLVGSDLIERYREAMETKEPVRFERYSDQLDFWEEVHVYPSDTGLSVYFRDVTDRKRRERELEESERRYRTLVEHFPNGAVALVDEDLRYRTVGGRPLDVADVTAEEAEGKPVDEVLPAALADLLVPRYEAALEGDASTFDAEVDEGTYQFHVVPVRDDDGEVFAALGMSQDITERREYQRRLEVSEQRYRALVDNFPNGGVALFDQNLEYTVAGGELFAELDIPEDEVVGTTVHERYPDGIAERMEQNFRAALDGESNTFEIEFHGRDWLVNTVPVGSDDGRVFAGMIMVQDITDRKRYRRKLEESNERLEQFAYAASHDLQEPLRMVSSYLQLIEDRYADALDADGEEFLAYAVDGADRMRAMIASLLRYSRVETQGDPFEPVDLDEVITDVLADIQLQIEEYDAEIAVDELPRVRGDPNQLRQLFQNLLDNAIEYSGDEPPRVHVSAEREGNEWAISIEDEGIGVDESDQDRIFAVFQRLHTRDEHEGIGVGLALSQRIVERHSGDIWIDSEPGEGSTFTFTLPSTEK